jgi:serine/threonine protein kinase
VQRSETVKAKDEPQWEIDFNQITLLNRVGGGTFGDVYRARLWGTEIAVKTLKAEDFESSDTVLDELKKEVSILSQLRHPNVVLYIGACTLPPHICIATEWCGRGSLHDVLEDHSLHVNAKLMVELAMGIAQGVNYLHSLEHRIIHRDLKSANILVNKNW